MTCRREASFVKRISFQISNASRFTVRQAQGPESYRRAYDERRTLSRSGC